MKLQTAALLGVLFSALPFAGCYTEPVPYAFYQAHGRYESKQPAAQLLLFPDGGARLTLRPTAKAEPVTEAGVWSEQEQQLRLQLFTRAGQPLGAPFVWSHEADSLVPASWDRKRFGATGLTLQRRGDAE